MSCRLKSIFSIIFIASTLCICTVDTYASPLSGINKQIAIYQRQQGVPLSGITRSIGQCTKQCKHEVVQPKQPKLKVKPKLQRKQVEKEHAQVGTQMDVPTDNSFKSFMDADCIRGASKQKDLKAKYVLGENGVWTVDGRYCIAVGSYYTQEIGTYIDVVMENGSVIECILAECKNDVDTDELNMKCKDGSVVEFVVNMSSLDKLVMKQGDCSYANEQWQGEIKSIIVYKTVAK